MQIRPSPLDPGGRSSGFTSRLHSFYGHSLARAHSRSLGPLAIGRCLRRSLANPFRPAPIAAARDASGPLCKRSHLLSYIERAAARPVRSGHCARDAIHDPRLWALVRERASLSILIDSSHFIALHCVDSLAILPRPRSRRTAANPHASAGRSPPEHRTSRGKWLSGRGPNK